MAGSAVGAVMFVWAIGALLGGSEVPAVKGAANVRADGVPLAVPAGSASNPPTTGSIRTSASGSPSASPSAAMPAASATSAVSGRGAAVTTGPTTTTPTTTTTTPPPGPPKTCPDSVLRISATAAKSTYPVGAEPVLTLHIGNAGTVPCIRDVSHQLRSIELLGADGRTRLWSSADCYSVHTDETRTLRPGQTLAYSVAWAGRTSAPGCPTERTTVPAGSYQLVGALGALTGPPTPLTLR
jgi:hypothetical protein